MARFAFVGPAYRSQSVNADCQTSKNLYLEPIESGEGKGAAALYQRGGLNLLYDLGPNPIRGEITTRAAQARTFVVSGITLFELFPPNAEPNFINRGQVVSDGKRVSMSFSPTQLLVVSAGNLYVFDLKANTLSAPVAPSDGTNGLLGTPLVVKYLLAAFYLLVLNQDGNTQIQQSANLDGTTWPAVAQTEVEVFSDNVLTIFEDHLRLWIFGPTKTAVYFDAGDFPFALDFEDGALMEHGLAAADAICKADNSIFWLAQSETGGYTVRRANGYTPLRVSTFAIEYELNRYKTVADCGMYSYQTEGHEFVVLVLPTAQKAWAYDAVASALQGLPCWFELDFWDAQKGHSTLYRAAFHTFNFGIHLVGDPTTGAVYEQSINNYSDFGNVIRRERTAPHISNEQARISHTELQLDLEVGLGPLFQGQAQPTIDPMLDAAGALRSLQMGENGILQAPLNPAGDLSNAIRLFINDQANTTSWEILITAAGALRPVQLSSYNDSFPVAIPFVTVQGDQNWTLQLENLGGGIAVLRTIPQGIVGRGPLVNLEWSNDGGKTFTQPRPRDCGQAGETRKRVIWRQLGMARDRVYRIWATDPFPVRIVDAYLYTDPEDRAPTSRLVREYAKRA